jgi:FHA domain-containing protein
VPILRDFERRLEGLVEGLFAKTSRSGLQPVELAKRLMREMDAGKVVALRGVVAPNRFVFSLSPVDGATFEQAEQAIVRELEQVVRDAAGERGWGLMGPPEVELEIDDDLRKGQFRVDASLVEGEEQVAPAPAGTGATLLIHEGGSAPRTVRVGGGTVTIGRLPECEVVVHDPGASRRHAQLREQQGAWTLTDLGSTNGTQLNGHTVQQRALADGDRITIGTTVIEFREDGR